jgi:hypothetical protein
MVGLREVHYCLLVSVGVCWCLYVSVRVCWCRRLIADTKCKTKCKSTVAEDGPSTYDTRNMAHFYKGFCFLTRNGTRNVPVGPETWRRQTLITRMDTNRDLALDGGIQNQKPKTTNEHEWTRMWKRPACPDKFTTKFTAEV